MDQLTPIGNTASLTLTDNYTPTTGPIAFYKVYGRGSCSGNSKP